MAGLLVSLDVSASGLAAMRRKMDATAANIAHAETTRTPEGGPYRRQVVIQREHAKAGAFSDQLQRASVNLRRTHARHIQPRLDRLQNPERIPLTQTESTRLPNVRYEYMPGHPDADTDGFVAMPDIDILAEMVEMMLAARSYEANATALEAAKQMAQRALDL